MYFLVINIRKATIKYLCKKFNEALIMFPFKRIFHCETLTEPTLKAKKTEKIDK